MSWWQPSDVLTAWPDDPDLLLAVEPVADPRRLLRLRVDEGDVAHVDRRFLVDDAAFLGTPSSLVVHLCVLLDHADALNEDALVLRVDLDHGALAANVLARDHDDPVALLYLHAT